MPLDTLVESPMFQKLLEQVATAAARKFTDKTLKAFQNVKLDYGPHLEQSFRRCTKIKTILDRDEPAELSKIYINVDFKSGKDRVPDHVVIDRIKAGKHAIISGTAGGGKSMFMRYLWISLSHDVGKIPLFIELRRFNDLSTGAFQTFLFRSAVADSINVEEADFVAALRAGAFSIVLDGFDEIVSERRKIVEADIVRFSHEYSENIIVVSSRPDDRFASWQNFTTFHVQPLNRTQVASLIEKVKFDSRTKSEFLKRLKNGLYEKHRSFLSNPLLATMMLITFDQFAEIPDKSHIFYDQAFEALFSRHDGTKEVFKRKTYTGLPIDSFKKVIAYFAIITYQRQKFEFNEDELIGFIRKTIQASKISLDENNFIKDLVESVCLIQRDGLLYSYTHRSFQEFFASYWIVSVTPDRIGDTCRKLSIRSYDNVMPMCFDMNQGLLESSYIGPVLDEIMSSLGKLNKERRVKWYIQKFGIFLHPSL